MALVKQREQKRGVFQLLGVLCEKQILETDIVRNEVQQILQAVAILGALILTMVQVVTTAEQTYPDPILNCSKLGETCSFIHSVMSVLALSLAVTAVMSSTTTYVFFTLAGTPKTPKYTHAFPNSFFVPFGALKLGIVAWVFDMYWLAVLAHGTVMMFVLCPLLIASLAFVGYQWHENQRWVNKELGALAGDDAMFDPDAE